MNGRLYIITCMPCAREKLSLLHLLPVYLSSYLFIYIAPVCTVRSLPVCLYCNHKCCAGTVQPVILTNSSMRTPLYFQYYTGKQLFVAVPPLVWLLFVWLGTIRSLIPITNGVEWCPPGSSAKFHEWAVWSGIIMARHVIMIVHALSV